MSTPGLAYKPVVFQSSIKNRDTCFLWHVCCYLTMLHEACHLEPPSSNAYDTSRARRQKTRHGAGCSAWPAFIWTPKPAQHGLSINQYFPCCLFLLTLLTMLTMLLTISVNRPFSWRPLWLPPFGYQQIFWFRVLVRVRQTFYRWEVSARNMLNL